MDAAIFWDFVSKTGLSFALVVLALLTGRAGIWVWGREMAQVVQQAEREKAELVKDRDYYRDIAFEALNRAEGAASKAEQAVGLAERGVRRHP